MNIKRANFMIVGAIVVAIAITLPLLAAKGVENTVYLTITRKDSPPADYVSVPEQIIAKYPSMLNATNEADRKYDAFVSWCSAQSVNCMQLSYAAFMTPELSTKVNIGEAQLAITGLPFKDIPKPDEVTVSQHGIHVEYNGKYYAIAIIGT